MKFGDEEIVYDGINSTSINIPALKNPYSLVINGISYDGSESVEINISGGSDGPDWEAASDEPGYIRNRTHYSDYQAIRTYYPRDVVLDEYGFGIFDCRGSLQTAVPGELRSITVDGIRYISTVQEINGYCVFGNHSFFGGDDNGQPIGAMINPDDTRQYYLCAFYEGWESRTISVEIAYLEEVVHQIPEKYVPLVPNPQALTINGVSYDGSEPVAVNTVNSEFVVTVTLDENGQATADKTAQELSDAYEAGRSLVCHLIGPDISYYLRVPFSYHVGLSFLFAGATNGAIGGFAIISNLGVMGQYYNATITIDNETWSGTFDVDFTKSINTMIDKKIETMTESGISVTDAAPGQTVKIAEVDENGVPTAWEAVDFPLNGKSAYDYAKEAGYEGKENEFALSLVPLSGTTENIDPVALAIAVLMGRDIIIEYKHDTLGWLQFTSFYANTEAYNIYSNILVETEDGYKTIILKCNYATKTWECIEYNSSSGNEEDYISNNFIVTITLDENGKTKSDKTFQEVLDAYSLGCSIVCNFSSQSFINIYIPLSLYTDSTFIFTNVVTPTSGVYITFSGSEITATEYNSFITIGEKNWNGQQATDFTQVINDLIEEKLLKIVDADEVEF